MILKRYALLLTILATITIVAHAAFIGLLKTMTPDAVLNRETGGVLSLNRTLREIEQLDCSKKFFLLGTSVSDQVRLQDPTFSNLSFYGAAPIIQREVIALLGQRLSSCPKATLVLVELLPSLFTQATEDTYILKNQLKLSAIWDYQKILQQMTTSPLYAMDVLFMKLRLNTAPDVTMNLLGRALFPAPSYTMEDSVRVYDEASDIRDLKLSPAVIDVYIYNADELKKFSLDVVFYRPPENTFAWQYSPLGDQNLNNLIERIEEKNYIALDLNSDDYQADDFRDALHLNAGSGNQKLTAAIKRIIDQSKMELSL